jgi:hypothetical protein
MVAVEGLRFGIQAREALDQSTKQDADPAGWAAAMIGLSQGEK